MKYNFIGALGKSCTFHGIFMMGKSSSVLCELLSFSHWFRKAKTLAMGCICGPKNPDESSYVTTRKEQPPLF